MMIDRSGGGAGSQSIWAVGRGIVRSEGVRGLYSGVTLAMVCVCVSCGVCVCVMWRVA